MNADPNKDEAIKLAIEILTDFSTGLSGPFKTDQIKFMQSVIETTERRASEALDRIQQLITQPQNP